MVNQTGATFNPPLTVGSLAHLLKNRFYIGESIAASMSRFSPASYLRLCRPSAPPTPSPGMFGSEALRPFWLVASSTTAATG
jgi:hypothetical protein